MSSKSTLDSVEMFYGTDPLGRPYTLANFNNSTAYDQQPNTLENPDRLNPMIYNLMLAKNYKDPQTAKGNDISEHFTDFIVNTAKWHSSIDKSTSTGGILGDIRKVLDSAIDFALDEQIKDNPKAVDWIDHDLDILIRASIRSNRGYLGAVGVGAPSQAVMTIREANLNVFKPIKTDKYLDCIIKYALFREVNNKMAVAPLDFDNLVGIIGQRRTLFTDQRNVTTGLGSLLAYVMFKPNNNNLYEIYGKHHNALRDQLFLDLDNELISAITQATDSFVKTYNAYMGSGINYDADQTGKINSYYAQIKTNLTPLRGTIKTTLVNAFFNVIQRQLQHPGHTVTLQTSVSMQAQFVDKLFKVWPELTNEAREFYRKHLHLMKRDGAGWKDVMEDGKKDEEELKKAIADISISTATLSDWRLNIRKRVAGARETMFEHTLPFLPSKVDKVYVTDSAGNVVELKKTQDVFKKLYNCAYTGSACDLLPNGANITLPPHKPKVPFDLKLDPAAYAKNYMLSLSRDTLMNVGQSVNMATGEIYTHNAEGELVPINKDYKPSDKCYGTMGAGDNEACAKFYECLLSNDSSKFSFCMETLGNQDFFKLADDELSKIEPNIAIMILRKFGFRSVIASNGLIQTQDYQLWARKVLSQFTPEVKKVIEGNQNLVQYLKGVIGFVNRNPAILNANYKMGSTNVAQQGSQPQQQQQQGLRRKRHYRTFGNSLVATNSPYQSLTVQIPQSPIALLTHRAVNVYTQTGGYSGMQTGGDGVQEHIDVVLARYISAVKEAEKHKIYIDDNDNKLITETYNRIAQQNRDFVPQIERMTLELVAWTQLLELFKDIVSPPLIRSTPVNKEDLSRFYSKYENEIQQIQKNVHEAQKCIAKNEQDKCTFVHSVLNGIEEIFQKMSTQ